MSPAASPFPCGMVLADWPSSSWHDWTANNREKEGISLCPLWKLPKKTVCEISAWIPLATAKLKGCVSLQDLRSLIHMQVTTMFVKKIRKERMLRPPGSLASPEALPQLTRFVSMCCRNMCSFLDRILSSFFKKLFYGKHRFTERKRFCLLGHSPRGHDSLS